MKEHSGEGRCFRGRVVRTSTRHVALGRSLPVLYPPPARHSDERLHPPVGKVPGPPLWPNAPALLPPGWLPLSAPRSLAGHWLTTTPGLRGQETWLDRGVWPSAVFAGLCLCPSVTRFIYSATCASVCRSATYVHVHISACLSPREPLETQNRVPRTPAQGGCATQTHSFGATQNRSVGWPRRGPLQTRGSPPPPGSGPTAKSLGCPVDFSCVPTVPWSGRVGGPDGDDSVSSGL